MNMTLNDFTKDDGSYISKERFLFANDKVKFWYRLILNSHEYMQGWGEWITRYQVLIVVDDVSIHSNHKSSFSKEYTCGFFLKQIEKRGKFAQGQLEKVLNSALKLKIENKIKVDNYQKILGIINGTSYSV